MIPVATAFAMAVGALISGAALTLLGLWIVINVAVPNKGSKQ